MTPVERERLFKEYLADCATEPNSPKVETLNGYFNRFKKAWAMYADGIHDSPFEVEDDLIFLPIKNRAVNEDGDGDTRRGFELYYSFLAEMKFKSLLEWFINQLRINNGIIDGKPTGGYGYKGNEIRQRYKAWRSYEGFDTDCSLRCDVPHSIANYIHYTESWINIVPVFVKVDEKYDVSGLKIILKPNNTIIKEYPEVSLTNLGLYNSSFPNHHVRTLFKEFKNEIMELQSAQKNTVGNPVKEEKFAELQLKLGIKSSLPNVKAAMALLIAFWESGVRENGYVYGVERGDSFVPSNEIVKAIAAYFEKQGDEVSAVISKNPLYTSQIEALQVAFELGWRVAKFEFENTAFPFSAERTGGKRYAKKVSFTRNIDLISLFMQGDKLAYKKILWRWIKQEVNSDDSIEVFELALRQFLTALSEECVYRIRTDAETVYIFRNYGVYDALQKNGIVNISDYKEQVGTLRILTSIVADGLNHYFQKANGGVELRKSISLEELSAYSERVKNYISLTDITVSFTETNSDDAENDVQISQAVGGSLKFNTGLQSNYTRNRILFGAPGTGKSFTLNQELKALLGENNESDYERVTFHPDYSYANFVGTYKPVMVTKHSPITADEDTQFVLSILTDKSLSAQKKYDLLFDKFKDDGLTRLPILMGLYTDEPFKTRKMDGSSAVGDNSVERNHGKAIRKYVNLASNEETSNDIAYEYVPGPFMRVYVSALKNARTGNPKPYLLIIEEINRANVAAVFGDIFQLLDRGDDNVSEYPIQASEDIKKYLAKELGGQPNDYAKIRIPDNMFIWATMNSADQGVFPMDTAFKRRWDFTYLGIDDSDVGIRGKFVYLGKNKSQKVEWNKLRKAINHFLAKEKINEDKQLGPYFISRNIIIPSHGDEIDRDSFIRIFKNKVIMYLFEDAAKQKRAKVFEGCSQDCTRYSEICREFDEKGVAIFNHEIVAETEFEVTNTDSTDEE